MAVLEGISINSRVVRQGYGIQALVPESEHNGPRYQPLKDEMYIGRDGVSRTKRMLWYFKEGDRADSNGTKVSHQVFTNFDSRHNTNLVIEVCLCNSDNPPPRKDKTVKPMCRFRCPMRALEYGDWQELVDDEGMVTRIRVKNVMLSMIFDGELRCMLRTGDDHAEFELEMELVVESEMEDGFDERCRIGFL